MAGCSLFRPHKMNIEQGNIITCEDVEKLRVGMSANEVLRIMGNPVLVNTFSDDRMNYVYTFEPAYCPMQEKRITLILRHGRVTEIERL